LVRWSLSPLYSQRALENADMKDTDTRLGVTSLNFRSITLDNQLHHFRRKQLFIIQTILDLNNVARIIIEKILNLLVYIN